MLLYTIKDIHSNNGMELSIHKYAIKMVEELSKI